MFVWIGFDFKKLWIWLKKNLVREANSRIQRIWIGEFDFLHQIIVLVRPHEFPQKHRSRAWQPGGQRFPVRRTSHECKKPSWGVEFIAVQRSDRMEWRASRSILSNEETGRLWDFNPKRIAFHTIPLYRSTWEFPRGWYGDDLLVATPRFVSYSLMSLDENDVWLSECL